MNWRQYAFPAAILGVAAIAGIVVLIANSGGDGDGGKASGGDCQEVSEPQPKDVTVRRPTSQLERSKTYLATVETSCGTFVIELDPKQAPKTGASFVKLAREGFYDGLGFHRIAPGFVIQGGDPAGNGSGGPGYKIRERPPEAIVYSEGVVAMAKGGTDPAGTSGSQFFVVTGENANLPPDYALLGQVTKGIEVAHRIEDLASSADGRPTRPVVIEKITISEQAGSGETAG
jgi:peptidyl-prolyl cis-trans isomerase B (cyclophilin B)